MGCVPTKLQRKNEASSDFENFDQQENIVSLTVSLEREDGQVLHERGKQNCEVFDVVVTDKSKSKRPDSLPTERVSSVLTKEKIDEKQGKAEKNRLQHLEAKKKTALKLAEVRSQQNDEAKVAKTNKLAEKQERAADNREKQLENIKTAALNSRGIINDDRSREKAEKTFLELEKKMAATQQNRQRIVDDVVRKQLLREEHADRVRYRVIKMMVTIFITRLLIL